MNPAAPVTTHFIARALTQSGAPPARGHTSRSRSRPGSMIVHSVSRHLVDARPLDKITGLDPPQQGEIAGGVAVRDRGRGRFGPPQVPFQGLDLGRALQILPRDTPVEP